MLDKVLFARLELVKLRFVGTQIDFLGGPETGEGVLVEPPVVLILNGKEDEAVRVGT